MEKSTISILTRLVKNCIVLDMIKECHQSAFYKVWGFEENSITGKKNKSYDPITRFSQIHGALSIIKEYLKENNHPWFDSELWGVRIRFIGKIQPLQNVTENHG